MPTSRLAVINALTSSDLASVGGVLVLQERLDAGFVPAFVEHEEVGLLRVLVQVAGNKSGFVRHLFDDVGHCTFPFVDAFRFDVQFHVEDQVAVCHVGFLWREGWRKRWPRERWFALPAASLEF
jgi:hypothetical protein